VVNSMIDPGMRNEASAEALKSGRAWMNSYSLNDLDQAIVLFKKALAIEPNSVLAHVYLAMAATSRTHFIADPKYLELGKSEAFKALSLDPNSVEAHRALAGVYYREGKFSEGLDEAMRTIEMGGAEEKISIFVGMTLDTVGRPDQALRWFQLVAKIQAPPGEVESVIGDGWAKLGDDERALAAYDRAMEMRPSSFQGAVGKCRVYLLRGEFEAARQICRTRFRDFSELGEMAQMAAQIEFFARNYAAAEELYARLAKADTYGGGSFYGAITYQSALGRIKQARGATDPAAKLLRESLETEAAAFNQQPGNSEAAYRLAAVEASLNLSEASLQHLRQAVALGWLDYRSLQKDPRFDSLRSNPEFDSLTNGLTGKVAELRRKADAR
jgi:tetratricopeptide (TPR) repeat protein